MWDDSVYEYDVLASVPVRQLNQISHSACTAAVDLLSMFIEISKYPQADLFIVECNIFLNNRLR